MMIVPQCRSAAVGWQVAVRERERVAGYVRSNAVVATERAEGAEKQAV